MTAASESLKTTIQGWGFSFRACWTKSSLVLSLPSGMNINLESPPTVPNRRTDWGMICQNSQWDCLDSPPRERHVPSAERTTLKFSLRIGSAAATSVSMVCRGDCSRYRQAATQASGRLNNTVMIRKQYWCIVGAGSDQRVPCPGTPGSLDGALGPHQYAG